MGEARIESAGVSGTHLRTSALQPPNIDEVLDLLDQQQPQLTKTVLEELAQARRELQRRDRAIRKLRQRLDQLENPAPVAPMVASSTTPHEPPHAPGVVHWQPLSFDTRSDSAGTDERRELEVEFEAETQFFARLNQDMAEGGVFVATYRVEPIGTALTLRFELPCGTPVTARGRVAWTRASFAGNCRPGMGVQFMELAPAALIAISRFALRVPPLYMEW
jgi:uncharacterized protein (TIGR02266 family)